MREALDEPTARWIGPIVDQLLPEGLSVGACYYSWEAGGATALAIIVAAPVLLAVNLDLEPGGGLGPNVRARSTYARTSDILAVEVDSYFNMWQSGTAQSEDHLGRIALTLVRDLGPLGSSATLPIKESDYARSVERQIVACRAFALALINALA
jgi:hypothetical protein